MENIPKISKEEMFEDETFINDCLNSFDENVSKIDAEYAVANKSA